MPRCSRSFVSSCAASGPELLQDAGVKSLPSRPATGYLAREETLACLPGLGLTDQLCLRRVAALRQAWCLSSRGTPETHAGVGGLALRPTMPSAVLPGWAHPASSGVGRCLACCSGAARSWCTLQRSRQNRFAAMRDDCCCTSSLSGPTKEKQMQMQDCKHTRASMTRFLSCTTIEQ